MTVTNKSNSKLNSSERQLTVFAIIYSSLFTIKVVEYNKTLTTKLN